MYATELLKRFAVAAAAFAGVFSVTSCIDLDHPNRLPEVTKVSQEQFASQVVGQAWKHVSTYEILQDGSLSKDEYYKDMEGGSPVHYYFRTSDQLYQFMSYPPFGTSITHESYVYAQNMVVTTHQHSHFQILHLDNRFMRIRRYLGYRDDVGDHYGYTTLKKMTRDELQRRWDDGNTVPKNLELFLKDNEGKFLYHYVSDFSNPAPAATGPYLLSEFFKVTVKDGKPVFEPYYLVRYEHKDYAFKSTDEPLAVHFKARGREMTSNLSGQEKKYVVLSLHDDEMSMDEKENRDCMHVFKVYAHPEVFDGCPEANRKEIEVRFNTKR